MTRSDLMRQVKSKHTKPEVLVRKYLHGQGIRFRLHDAALPGTPDIVLKKYHAVILVQGCFWHMHGKECALSVRPPRSNLSYWIPKLERNVQRDSAAIKHLQESGWRVLIVWECELKRTIRGATLARLTADILQQDMNWEYLQVA